jgi:hypothetical protein
VARELVYAEVPEYLPGLVVKVLPGGKARVRFTQASKFHRDLEANDLEGISRADAPGERIGVLRPPEGAEITDEMREAGQRELEEGLGALAGEAAEALEKRTRETMEIGPEDVGEMPEEVLNPPDETPPTS